MSSNTRNDESQAKQFRQPNEVVQATDPLRVTCSQCSHENPIQRVWCEKCESPIDAMPAVLLTQDTSSLSSREDLYRQVLEDLDRLGLQPDTNSELLKSIREFYQGQAEKVRQSQNRLKFERARQNLIARIKSLAHAGQLEQALHRIGQEAVVPQLDPILSALREEVTAHWEAEKQAAKLAREVQSLHQQADGDLAGQHFQLAINKLSQAAELLPESQHTLAKLARARGLLADFELQQREAAAEENGKVSSEPVSTISPPKSTADTVVSSGELVPSIAVAVASAGKQVDSHVLSEEARPSFEGEPEIPTHAQRQIDAFSQWTSLVKPFLLDNVGWFVGAFLVIAGFVVLIVTFWNTIEQNQILVHTLVFACLFIATGMFFSLAYFMRSKYPQLESSSDVLLVIVALMIPLVFAAAILTALMPAADAVDATAQLQQLRSP